MTKFLSLNIQVKYTVVTTFNLQGYKQYGQRMIQTWLDTWPSTVDLMVYAEQCQVHESAKNLHVLDLDQVQALADFKQKWRHVPWANGDVRKDPVRGQRKDAGKQFKWDAVRFAHKVYSIFDCASHCQADYLIWMDADTICHSHISRQDLDRLCTEDLCYLGRKNKYSECGLYAMRLNSQKTKEFLTRFQWFYDSAEQGIFTLPEWHDSYVFDHVRQLVRIPARDWSAGIITGEGHPLINSDWGAYLDHLKGNRKQKGRSHARDLVVPRQESYWQ